MATAIDKVKNGLDKLKQLGEGPSTLAARDQAIQQLKVLSFAS